MLCAKSVSAPTPSVARNGAVTFENPVDLMGAVKERRNTWGGNGLFGVVGAEAISIL